MIQYDHYDVRDAWLANRDDHIGASEAGAILGVGFMSKVDLWKIKTGRMKSKELSDNAAVQYGNRAENPLRYLFMAKHPELSMQYRPYDFVYQSERPWLRATLDGEIYPYGDPSDKGILEIKTATCMSRADWAKWNGRVPDGYLAQLSHQFLATGFSHAYLFAELTGADGNSEIRTYYFTREDMRENMDYLLAQEEEFWDCVVNDRMPSVPLRI